MITLQLPWACCSLLIGLLSACTRGVDSPDPRLVAMRKAITEVTSNAWKTVSDCPGAVGSLSLSYEDLQLLSAALQRYTDDEILSFVEWPIISDLNDLKAEIARSLELAVDANSNQLRESFTVQCIPYSDDDFTNPCVIISNSALSFLLDLIIYNGDSVQILELSKAIRSRIKQEQNKSDFMRNILFKY
jgi:hypothetical protein